MQVYCDNCRYLFDGFQQNCPVCGRPVKLDTQQSDASFLENGYSYYNNTVFQDQNTAPMGLSRNTSSFGTEDSSSPKPSFTRSNQVSYSGSESDSYSGQGSSAAALAERLRNLNNTEVQANDPQQQSFSVQNYQPPRLVGTRHSARNIPWRTIITVLLVLIALAAVGALVYVIWQNRTGIEMIIIVVLILIGTGVFSRRRRR